MAVHERCRPLRYIGTWKDHHYRCLLIAAGSGNRIITSKVSYFSKHKNGFGGGGHDNILILSKKPKEKLRSLGCDVLPRFHILQI